MLSVQDLNISYGNIRAVKGISFDVHEGEIVTLIGANGAGKSSTLRAISGIIPYKGKINYQAARFAQVPADKIVAMGIAQVPEGRGIFGNLTVLRKSEAGYLAAQRQGGDRARLRACVCDFPAPEGAPEPAGRYAFGRRAANAGGRTRP